jgi:hypothetical protein
LFSNTVVCNATTCTTSRGCSRSLRDGGSCIGRLTRPLDRPAGPLLHKFLEDAIQVDKLSRCSDHKLVQITGPAGAVGS